jgi:hypothetical protein
MSARYGLDAVEGGLQTWADLMGQPARGCGSRGRPGTAAHNLPVPCRATSGRGPFDRLTSDGQVADSA